MDEMWKNSAIIAKRNVDDNQSPISVQLSELKQIIEGHSCIVLNQLPDIHQGIYIDGFTEVNDIEKITSKNYKVDYANGVVYFNPVNVGKVLTIDYYGIGYTLLSASRIYTKYDKYGNVLETLEELIDKSKLYLEAIELLGGSVEVITRLENANDKGTALHENLIKDIENGTQIEESLVSKTEVANNTINTLTDKTNLGNQTIEQLIEKNNIATQKKTDLDKSIKNAIDTNTTLNNTSESATQINLTLQQTRAEAQDDINKINATGNKSLTISGAQFVDNEYTWEHNMNTRNLNITMFDGVTDEPLLLDCKPVDDNNILIRNSSEHPNVRIVLQGSYYSGNTAIGTIMEEFAGISVQSDIKKIIMKDSGTKKYQIPVTNSDAVYMPDGNTNLTRQLKNYLIQVVDDKEPSDISGCQVWIHTY